MTPLGARRASAIGPPSGNRFPKRHTLTGEQDEAHLVRASQRGDQEAFALLVGRYQHRLFNLNLGMLKDSGDARESTQETFVTAWQRLPELRDEARFSTWLYRIAYQCGLRQLERSTRVHAWHSAGQGEQIQEKISTQKQGAETTENPDPQALVREQLESLPLTYRSVLLLRHLHNQTYEEIAAILSMPSGTVKTHLFRARTLLKERLACTAPLVARETVAGTPLTGSEAVMHLSGPLPFEGREQNSIPTNQETDDFSRQQQVWLAQQLDWVEQQRSALTQREAWVQQRRGWLEQQQGWLEQRRDWLVEQRSWLNQRRGWLSQQDNKLTQQEAWLVKQEAWLDQQHTALVQQYSEMVQQHHWVQQQWSWLDRQQRWLTQQDSTSVQGDEGGKRLSG